MIAASARCAAMSNPNGTMTPVTGSPARLTNVRTSTIAALRPGTNHRVLGFETVDHASLSP